MYSRLFTPYERDLITRFLKGRISPSDPKIRKLKSRMKSFDSKDLGKDVSMYHRFLDKIDEPVPARSTKK